MINFTENKSREAFLSSFLLMFNFLFLAFGETKKDTDYLSAEKNTEESQRIFEEALDDRLQDKEEEALTEYRRALEMNPKLGENLLDEGVTDYFLGKYFEARQSLEKAKELFEFSGDFQHLQIAEEYLDKMD